MPAIKLSQFGGMLPAWDPHLLPVGQATYARDAYLFAGTLQGWRKPKSLRTLTNSSARMAYRIPHVTEAQAVAYLAFKTQPNPGDTVVVGEQTYTYRTALNDPFDVLIGADVTASAQYLMEALTADNGENTNAGVHYGADTPLNGAVKYYPPDDAVQAGLTAPSLDVSSIGGTDYTLLLVGAIDFGAAYNLVKVSESTSNARLTWLYDDSAFGHTTSTYRGGTNPSFSPDITAASEWLEFDDPDTNVVRSPVIDDQWERYYFASPSQMPEYNTYQRIVDGDPSWLLGVPAPGCAVTLDVTGGGNNIQLGNTSQSALNFNALGNTIYVTKITPAGSLQLSDVAFSTLFAATAARFAAVLYTDDAGVPGTLLNTGAVVTGVVATGTDLLVNTSTFLNPTGLNADTPYWIGIIIDSAVTIMQGPAGAPVNNVSHWTQTFSSGPAAIAPAATVGAGLNIYGDFLTSDILESRAYVYTWVSEYGEEGPPSPPTLLDGWSNGVWTIGLWQPPPDDTGVLRNLKKLNIYRTIQGTGGTTVFFYVTSVDIGTAIFVDTISDATVALNDVLESTHWFPPPAGLLGITVLQNGMIAGFTKNEVWFCEPFRPHAWPPAYVKTVDFPIVGLGVTSGVLVVCTASVPYTLTGNSPGEMVQYKCSDANPCSSRASILGGTSAVSYMSQNGLIQVTPAGVATNTTDMWFTRENWQQLTPQKFTRAILMSSSYVCMGSTSPDGTDNSEAQRGFTIALDQDNTSFTIWPQPGGHRLGFCVWDSPTGQNIQNLLTDPWTGIGLVVSDGKVWYFDFADPTPERQVYTWKSKLYQQNTKRSYSAMKVFFTVPDTTPTQNPTRIEAVASSSVWNTLPADSYGFIKTYVDVDGTGDMVLIDCREIRKPGEVLRIVDGFKAEHWQWEITGRVTISNVQVATSIKELSQT